MSARGAPDGSGSRGLERLGVTLAFSLLAHAVLAFGIGFDFEEPAPRLPSLDVILLQSANTETPERADFLAQTSNSGGGEHTEAHRPSAPVSGALADASAGLAPLPIEASSPAPSAASAPQKLTSARADFSVQRDEPTARPAELDQAATSDLERRKMEMARLAQELRRESDRYAKRPKKKYVSANTREYEFAAYMRAWVARIERIGNLNYPDEARRRQLHGQLVLTVGLARNGQVLSVDVIQSSGHKVLDDAAIRIVRLAEPFPALPASREQVDELYISRTWQFLPGDILRNR